MIKDKGCAVMIILLDCQMSGTKCMATCDYFNAFHTAGECRRQVKNVTNLFKKVNILEFHDHIWNHHDKCVQQSTNMPGIGSVIHEIDIKISEI